MMLILADRLLEGRQDRRLLVGFTVVAHEPFDERGVLLTRAGDDLMVRFVGI